MEATSKLQTKSIAVTALEPRLKSHPEAQDTGTFSDRPALTVVATLRISNLAIGIAINKSIRRT